MWASVLFLAISGGACQNSMRERQIRDVGLPLVKCPLQGVTIVSHSQRRLLDLQEDPGQNDIYVREERFILRCSGRQIGEILATTAGQGIAWEMVSIRHNGLESTIFRSQVDSVGAGGIGAVRVDETSVYFEVSMWSPWRGLGVDRYRYDWPTGKLYVLSQ